MRLTDINAYKEKRVRRNYWPGDAFIQWHDKWIDSEGEMHTDGRWTDQNAEPLKFDPEVAVGRDCDEMWEEWNESMMPTPEPPYVVEVVPITLEKHPNADTLSIVHIKGWTCVVKTSIFQDYDKAAYIQPDSVAPDTPEFRDALGIAADKPYKQSDFRIRAIKLRGIFSQGLMLPPKPNWQIGDNVAEELGVIKYEPPMRGCGRGGNMAKGLGGDSLAEPPSFHHYTKIQRWENYPDIIEEGEDVSITEKIHGANWRAALIFGEFYVGSHKTCKRAWETSDFWQMAWKYNIEDRLRSFVNEYAKKSDDPETFIKHCSVILFGEVYGGGIQHLNYDMKDNDVHDLRLFDISINGRYLNHHDFLDACKHLDLPVVPILYTGSFKPELLELANGRDFSDSHYREGVIVKPTVERWNMKLGRVILKKISQEYELDKKRTDFH